MSAPSSSSSPAPRGGDASVAVELHEFSPAYELRAFLRIAELPHVIVTSRLPSYGSGGSLPLVAHGSALARGGLAGGGAALAYLRSVRPPAGDEGLNETQAADAAAWSALVHGPLGDALLRSRLAGCATGEASLDGMPWDAGRALQSLAAPLDETLAAASSR